MTNHRPAGDSAGGEDLIDGYTRAAALADGVLIAVPPGMAANAGFRCAVALTRQAWDDCVAWDATDNARKGTAQDQDGRLRDVAWMAGRELDRVRPDGPGPVPFTVCRVPRAGMTTRQLPAGLVAWLGPGDDGEPVVTITRPEED
jgi:hypothetical protein